jgi:hypothetical protein
MKKLLILVTSALLFSVSVQAEVQDCDVLQDEIHEKISGNGVEDFDLLIVDKDDVNDHDGYQVVGSCEAGSQKILYKNLYQG